MWTRESDNGCGPRRRVALVHRTYMGGIERGERNLTLKSLERIAGQLGIDPLALLRPAQRESERSAGRRTA